MPTQGEIGCVMRSAKSSSLLAPPGDSSAMSAMYASRFCPRAASMSPMKIRSRRRSVRIGAFSYASFIAARFSSQRSPWSSCHTDVIPSSQRYMPRSPMSRATSAASARVRVAPTGSSSLRAFA